MENVGIDLRGNTDTAFQFRCAALQAMTINKSGVKVKNFTVAEKATVQNIQVDNDIIAAKFFSSNATSKSLIQFQANLRQNQLYYYNLDVEKYYETGQNINGKNY